MIKQKFLGLLIAIIFIWGAAGCKPTAPTPLVLTVIPDHTGRIKATLGSDTPFANCFVTYQAPVAFLPGNRIVIRAANGVQLFNLDTQKEEAFLKSPAPINGPVVAVSPDGKTLAWALEDASIQLIQLADQKVLHTLAEHSAPVTRLRFSPDGQRLYSASHDTSVRLWDVSAGSQVASFQPAGADNLPSEVLGLGLSPDGTLLATLPADGPTRLWNAQTFAPIRDLGGSGGFATSDVVFSTDGQWAAAGAATGLTIWRVSSGKPVLIRAAPVNSMAAAYSPDGKTLAYGDLNRIVLASPDGCKPLQTLEGHQTPVSSLVFSPDGALLASADDQDIRIWRVSTGELLEIGNSQCP